MDKNRGLISKSNSIQNINNKISIVDEFVNSRYILVYQYAKKIYSLGLNVTCIHQKDNEDNKFAKDKLKHPSHEYKHFGSKRQSEIEFRSYDWKNSVGLGTIAGFNKLVVIDIDNCPTKKILNSIMNELDLPEDYPWIVASGSRSGFHIYLSVEKPSNLAGNQVVTSYEPNDRFRSDFEKIELLWNTHVVLPPSLHKSGNSYSFLNSFPTISPIIIDSNLLISTIDKFVRKESKKNGTGYII